MPSRGAAAARPWRGTRRVLGPLALVAAAIAIALSGCGSDAAPTAATTPPGIAGGSPVPDPLAHPPDFALRDQDGRLVRLSEERGHLVVVTFLYTSCPDVCPLIAQNLRTGLRRLDPGRRDDVRVLAVSVDPAGDTPAAVHRFIASHRLPHQFRYLTGTRAQLAPVWKDYAVAAVPTAAGDQQIDHSAYELFIDRDGVARVIFGATITPSQAAAALRALGA